MRKTNTAGLALIKKYEGYRAEAYLDTGGVWTVGYGHTSDGNLKVTKGTKISKAKAEQLLAVDLSEAEDAVSRLVKVDLNDNQFATLVSFVYNLGEGAFKKSTLLRKLNKGQYSEVPNELMRFVFDNGVRIDGLVNRRSAEVGLWAKSAPVLPSTTVVNSPTTEPFTEVLKKPEILVGVGVPVAGGIFQAVVGSTIFSYAIGFVVILAALGFGYWFFKMKFGQA